MSDENQKDGGCTADHKYYEFTYTTDDAGDFTFQVEFCPDHDMLRFTPIIVPLDEWEKLSETLQKFVTHLRSEKRQLN